MSIVQFSNLGRYGRLGNQIFQYVFARAYAEKYGAELQIPSWMGEELFKDVKHPVCSKKLPEIKEEELDFGQVDIDLIDYFQNNKAFSILSESKIREWLVLRGSNVDTVGVLAHCREGDFLNHKDIYCIVNKYSYYQACVKYNIDHTEIIWYPKSRFIINDFYELVNAKILLRGNSTFAFWAGFFNKNKVYSPIVQDLVGKQTVDFAPNNFEQTTPRNNTFIFGD